MSMGYGIPNMSGTFKSTTADMSAYQFHIAKFSATRTVTVAAAATDLVIGIINNKPYADTATRGGYDVKVIMSGEAKMVAGGSISAGAFVVADASGHGVSATLGTTTTNVAVGRALEDADANDVIRVMVAPQFIQV
jgi:hypothetical protein